MKRGRFTLSIAILVALAALSTCVNALVFLGVTLDQHLSPTLFLITRYPLGAEAYVSPLLQGSRLWLLCFAKPL